MEIRYARRGDIPRLVELGEEFAIRSQPFHTFSISRERIINFANDVVENDAAVVLVIEYDEVIQGFIVGMIQQIFFSNDVALQELVWYVKDGFRGIKLLDAFVVVAKDIGCHKVVVGNKPLYCDLQKTYERRGFKFLENHYVKSLED